jgi:PIN domain nuclease of toxin-antitoxin system
MSLLLDTHAYLWFVAGDKQLPQTICNKIKDVNQPCFISIASFWEIAIKLQLGKLQSAISLQALFDFAEKNQVEVIPINQTHLLTLSNLPQHHGDPFDRLIIAQALSEKLTLVSRDKYFKKYKVKTVWSK